MGGEFNRFSIGNSKDPTKVCGFCGKELLEERLGKN
jgi:hypothetical protein